MTIEQILALGAMGFSADQIAGLTAGTDTAAASHSTTARTATTHEAAYGRTVARMADAAVRIPVARRRAPRVAGSLRHYRVNGRPLSNTQLAGLFPSAGAESNVARVYRLVMRAGAKGAAVPALMSAAGISDKAVQSAIWYLRNHDRTGQRVEPESRTAMLTGGAR